jgi:hypothetical protein
MGKKITKKELFEELKGLAQTFFWVLLICDGILLFFTSIFWIIVFDIAIPVIVFLLVIVAILSR